MKKLLLLIPVVLSLAIFASPATAETTPCTGSITVFEGHATFEGSGNCVLLAYKFKDGVEPGAQNLDASLPQTLVASDSKDVPIPECAGQIDLVQGDAVIVQSLTVNNYYSSHNWLVDHAFTGDVPCEEATTTTTSTTTSTTSTSTTATTIQATTTTDKVESLVVPRTLPRTGAKIDNNVLGATAGTFLMVGGVCSAAGVVVAARRRTR